MKKLSLPFLISNLLAFPTFASDIEEVYVSADFAQTLLAELPEATTVIGEDAILKRNAEHLEQVLSYAPNVNISSGSSRARYFQIRGIGERSQFIDPINPSVGLVIDDIDMTGLGAAATLFDIQQVEVLRGPQGTRFGANALAGMINVKSNDPTQELEGRISARAGNYDSYGLGGAVSGKLSDALTGRIAVHNYESDGYIENRYLDREDTNNIDEFLVRGKLHYQISDNSSLDLIYLHADIDNGYDAFSLDNTRETLSDEPGKDTQETDALALNFNANVNDAVALYSSISASDTDIEYSYDEDWTFVGIAPGWEYSSFDQYLRDAERATADVRLSSTEAGRLFSDSTDWVIGLNVLKRDENLTRNYTYAGQYKSELEVRSTAIYAELTTELSDSDRIITGIRFENWKNDFKDSNSIQGATDEDLVGGKFTYEKDLNSQHFSYASYARGYKAGGINSDPDVSENNRSFDTEFNNVFELGLKSRWSDRFRTAIAIFNIERKDQQVKSSYAFPNEDNNGFSFQEFFSNAAEGRNRGIEIEGQWDISDRFSWTFSYGYLDTEFSDYSFQTNDGEFNISGRSQAHAPEFSGASSITYLLAPALSFDFEVEAKDAFYFSDSHDLRSDSYTLFHARLNYATDSFSVALYGRNLGDEDYAVRGFGFPNDPRDEYTSIGYIQLGEPRTFGVSGSFFF